MTGRVSAIDCPNCGAGISVLGGGRVTTQVCSYCGASLDASDAFQVLKVNAERPRPASPFRLGMTGMVDGVEQVIIGTIGYVERHGGRTWRWCDHMLYSPTHGYSWLTVEDGHTLLTRKVRDWPEGSFLTTQAVERAENRPSRVWRGFRYTYYASSTWEIDFVEGGFTWRPEVGQRGSSVSLMPAGGATDMVTYAETGDEREVEVTRYLPEAAAAFGATPPVPEGTHPLQPYRAAPGKRFYTLWFAGMTAAALVLMLAVVGGGGARETLYEGPPGAVPPKLTFDVARAGRPVRIQLYQDLAQSWSEYEVTVTDPAGEALAETARGISYYYGGSGEDSWSEGSRFASLDFAPTLPGRYLVEVAAGQADTAAAGVPLRITAQAGRGNVIWVAIAAGLFAVALVWTATAGMRHRIGRWAGSDWTEEDD